MGFRPICFCHLVLISMCVRFIILKAGRDKVGWLFSARFAKLSMSLYAKIAANWLSSPLWLGLELLRENAPKFSQA